MGLTHETATYSVKELVGIYKLTSIHELDRKVAGRRIIGDICKSIVFRENWQDISHITTFTDGSMLALIPTKNWSDGDGDPVYTFHFHLLYKKSKPASSWKLVDFFYPKEFEPKGFRKEMLRERIANLSGVKES